MSNVRELIVETDCKEVISEALEHAEEFDGVIIIGLKKDGTQSLRSSTMSGMQKAFLVSFMNAWMNHWFELGEQ